MINFILNNKSISTSLPPGMLVLDFVRYQQNLMGTKIGCREGDCGACTILVGEIKNDQLVYNSATSCLMPLGNAVAKHIVTIEGINTEGLNFIQQAFAEEGATQCGFCTPGFIVSLTGHCINKNAGDNKSGIEAVDGNICRCTGYKSIERAIATIDNKLDTNEGTDAIKFAVDNNMLPAWFSAIKERLQMYSLHQNGKELMKGNETKFLGGGTDLYVQQHEKMVDATIDFLFNKPQLKGIQQEGNKCIMGASITVTDILGSPVFKKYFPSLEKHISLVSSTPIRNMATIGGNFVNASPIGDMTIFFLALDATLILNDGEYSREIALKDFYLGYKTLNKTTEEFIEKIYFSLPTEESYFNFEKVSKRTNLDIATVNTAISLKINDGIIKEANLSAGGVGPVPLYLAKSSAFLKGKLISAKTFEELIDITQSEISPISDARGTDMYKSLLLSQLIKAHFITLFPSLEVDKLLFAWHEEY